MAIARDKFWIFGVRAHQDDIWLYPDTRGMEGRVPYGCRSRITPAEAGYEKVRISPHPSERLQWMSVEFESRKGVIKSAWRRQDNRWRYEIETPTESVIVIDGKEHNVPAGKYVYFS